MSKSTLALKKEYWKFRHKMISKMHSIGIDHCLPYMLEQYFEDFEKSICMDRWEDHDWYMKESDLKEGSPAIVFKGMRKKKNIKIKNKKK